MGKNKQKTNLKGKSSKNKKNATLAIKNSPRQSNLEFPIVGIGPLQGILRLSRNFLIISLIIRVPLIYVFNTLNLP